MRLKVIIIIFLAGVLIIPCLVEARQGCCSWHSGVCGCRCCDGSPLSAKCAPYYPSCNSVLSVPLDTNSKFGGPTYEDTTKHNDDLPVVGAPPTQKSNHYPSKTADDPNNGLRFVVFTVIILAGVGILLLKERHNELITLKLNNLKIKIKEIHRKHRDSLIINTIAIIGFLIMLMIPELFWGHIMFLCFMLLVCLLGSYFEFKNQAHVRRLTYFQIFKEEAGKVFYPYFIIIGVLMFFGSIFVVFCVCVIH